MMANPDEMAELASLREKVAQLEGQLSLQNEEQQKAQQQRRQEQPPKHREPIRESRPSSVEIDPNPTTIQHLNSASIISKSIIKPLKTTKPKSPSPPSVLKPSRFSPVVFEDGGGGAVDLAKRIDGGRTHVAGTGEFFSDLGENMEEEEGMRAGRGQTKIEVGRVLPAGHPQNDLNCDLSVDGDDDDNDNDDSDHLASSLSSLESSFESTDFTTTAKTATHPLPVQPPITPKTPAGVHRTKPPGALDPDPTTSDIFSPNNISQGACLEKFGYAPGEIVNKLFSEHVISAREDRVVRYLLAHDDRQMLGFLMMIEGEGITKASVKLFREELGRKMEAFRNSPKKKNMKTSKLFFDESADGGKPEEPPIRPDTSMDINYERDDAMATSPPPGGGNRGRVDSLDSMSSGGAAGNDKENVDSKQEKNRHQQQLQLQLQQNQPIPQPIPFQTLIHKVLVKIATRLRELGPSTRQKVILVGSGVYNPLHRLHLRMFYLARQFLEGHSSFEVLGGIVSPSHSTAVRQKFRQKPKEIIPPKHRLSMARLTVGDSAWLTVDPWEITRRRVLDYLSVLDHVRELVENAFPSVNIKLIYLCKGNMLPKLNSEALVERNCNCLCICRPMAVDILLKQLTKEWKNVAYVLEDTAILSNDLERINSAQVRFDAINGSDVSKATCKKVANYMRKHKIGEKMNTKGNERWNKEDKEFDFENSDENDRPYIKMPEQIMKDRRKDRKTNLAPGEDILGRNDSNDHFSVGGSKLHKEAFSLLF